MSDGHKRRKAPFRPRNTKKHGNDNTNFLQFNYSLNTLLTGSYAQTTQIALQFDTIQYLKGHMIVILDVTFFILKSVENIFINTTHKNKIYS